MIKKITVAIDGPAGSGKSTVARLLAKKLGVLNIDSGAVYRAVTLLLLRKKVDLRKRNQIKKILSDTKIELVEDYEKVSVLLNGQDVSKEIRSLQVTGRVSAVSKKREVREFVNALLTEIAEDKSVVMEGRDIGTVVLPNADLKIFLEATSNERARRRNAELRSSGMETNLEQIKKDIIKRDRLDSRRAVSPLKKADDAILIDTTDLEKEEVVDRIANKLLAISKKI